jgi:hypothetical protein
MAPQDQFIVADLDAGHLVIKTSEVIFVEQQLNEEVRTPVESRRAASIAPRGHEANARHSSPPARAQPLRSALGRLKAIGPSLARRQPSATYRGRLCLASDRLGRSFRAWFAPRDRPPAR